MSSSGNNSNKSITYSSTRGGEKHINFRTVVMQGLARDRGLFVPDEIPIVSHRELELWRTLKTYDEVAYEVISKFIKNDQIPQDKLKEIIKKSFRRSTTQFRHDDVTPVVQVGEHSILELFHGPTFAFKDIALQMLGNIFEYFLETGSESSNDDDNKNNNNGQQQQQKIAILGATSGDTGSAAISGLRGKKGVDCFILYPKNRVSTIQEQQMTTIVDDNIHCIAIINGTFDDCQDIVKASFNTTQFRNDVQLGAINSINWCRVLVQTTYYFWSYLRVTDQNNKNNNSSSSSSSSVVVNYSVPTGNFGDVLAGYYSKQMGLPIDKLIVATNENDILYRFFTVGEYHKSMNGVAKTISPSMDICISSNFERYLYHLSHENCVLLNAWMYEFETTSKLTIKGEKLKQAQLDFMTSKSNTQQTLDIIKLYYEKYNYILCPHSAVGVCAIHQLAALQKEEVSSSSSSSQLLSTNTICLATAHHGKFPDAVKRVINPLPEPPKQLAELSTLPTKRTELPNDLIAVQTFVRECVTERNNNKKRNKSRSSSSSSKTTTTTTTCSICSTIKNTSITTTGACIAIGIIALVTIQIIRLSKKQQQRSLQRS